MDDDDPIEEETPILRDIIDRAIAPYREIYPPAIVAMMRREAVELFKNHPYPVALLHALKNRPAPIETIDPNDAETAKPASSKRTGSAS